MGLFEDAGIQENEWHAYRELRRSFEVARNRHLITEAEKQLLHGPRTNLSAVNTKARILFFRALCSELEKALKYRTSSRQFDRKVYLVTLVDIECAVPHGEIGADVAKFGRHFQRAVNGLDYIGIIEPGLYRHITFHAGPEHALGKCISWHVHCLLWNARPDDLRELVRQLNRSREYVGLTPSQTAADHRRVRDLDYVVGYVCKPPTFAYSIGLRKRDRNGNPCEPRSKQYKDALRPGERVTFFRQLMHLRLPDLLIAGGKGEEIRRATLRSIAP